MTFTTAFPIIFIAIFFITLLIPLVPNGLVRLLLLGLDLIIYFGAMTWYSNYTHASLYDNISSVYGLLLLVAYFSAPLFAQQLTKLRAGKLLLRLRRQNLTDILNLIAVPIFFCGALYTLVSTEYRTSDGALSLLMFILGLIFLDNAVQRTEFRQRGLVQDGKLWQWNEFESHEWHAMNDKPAEVELTFKLKPRVLSLKQIKLRVPQSNRQTIDDLLAKAR